MLQPFASLCSKRIYLFQPLRRSLRLLGRAYLYQTEQQLVIAYDARHFLVHGWSMTSVTKAHMYDQLSSLAPRTALCQGRQPTSSLEELPAINHTGRHSRLEVKLMSAYRESWYFTTPQTRYTSDLVTFKHSPFDFTKVW